MEGHKFADKGRIGSRILRRSGGGNGQNGSGENQIPSQLNSPIGAVRGLRPFGINSQFANRLLALRITQHTNW
jgi:hypothetical protein